MTSSLSTCMEYTGRLRDASGAANFKEISSFLNFFQETFVPLLSHKDAEQSNDKLTSPSTVHRGNKEQNQKIPDVKSQEEFPALGVSVKKTSPP